jgi:hypothetical protein
MLRPEARVILLIFARPILPALFHQNLENRDPLYPKLSILCFTKLLISFGHLLMIDL